MNADYTPSATCSQCRFYQKFEGQGNGLCRFNPPTAFPSGGEAQPKRRDNSPACGQISLLREGEAPAVKEKTQPLSPASARKK